MLPGNFHVGCDLFEDIFDVQTRKKWNFFCYKRREETTIVEENKEETTSQQFLMLSGKRSYDKVTREERENATKRNHNKKMKIFLHSGTITTPARQGLFLPKQHCYKQFKFSTISTPTPDLWLKFNLKEDNFILFCL